MWCGGGSELVIGGLAAASSLRLALPCGCWPMRQRGLGAGRLSEGPADERRGVWAGSGRASAGGRRREVGVGKACDGGGAQWDKRRVFE